MDLRAEGRRGNPIPAPCVYGVFSRRVTAAGVSQNTRHTCHGCHPAGRAYALHRQKRKEGMRYALCNPALPEAQGGRRGGLLTPQRAQERSLQEQSRY